MTPKYLPIILAVLALASLVAAVTLQILHDDPSNEWTAFLSFSAALLGVHIPAPVQPGTTVTTTTGAGSGTP